MQAETRPGADPRPAADPQPEAEGRGWGLITGVTVALLALGALFTTLLATGRWWLPPVASAHGAEIDRLFYTILVIIGTVFLLVQLTLAYFVLRFGSRPGTRALHWHDNRRLELLWTIIPAVILVALTTMGGLVWARIHTAPPPDAFTVEVTAEQFGWWVRYPGPDGVFGRTGPGLITRQNPLGLDPGDPLGGDDVVLLNDLRVPVERPVRVFLRAKDVIHSFFVPELRVKQDAVPGRTIEFWFTPTVRGEFEIACAELCGVGHFGMRGKLTVLSPDALEAWLAEQGH